MQRFEFRLERVLTLKQQRERLAEARQKQARVALDAARAAVTTLKDRIATNAAAYEAALLRGDGAGSWLARCQQSARFADTMALLEAKVAQTAAAYDEASAARTKAAQEVEALAALKRQQWDDYRLKVGRARQEQLDEVGLRRWRAARPDAPDYP